MGDGGASIYPKMLSAFLLYLPVCPDISLLLGTLPHFFKDGPGLQMRSGFHCSCQAHSTEKKNGLRKEVTVGRKEERRGEKPAAVSLSQTVRMQVKIRIIKIQG